MKELLKNKMMIITAITLLGITFTYAYIQKNDLSNCNEPSQIENINK